VCAEMPASHWAQHAATDDINKSASKNF